MANTLKHKQSSVAGKVPTTTDLALGELAINTNDGKLYLKKNVSGTESIVDVTAGSSAPALADITDWPSAVSATEVGYLDGVTSGIQTQLDGKAPSSHTHSYQPLDADLTAIAALAGTSGFLKKTAADTWALDTATSPSVSSISGNTNSAKNTNYVLGPSSATLTLPASPATGDTIGVCNTTATGWIIARNGQNIQGLAENLTVDQEYAAFDLIYIDATNGWRLF